MYRICTDTDGKILEMQSGGYVEDDPDLTEQRFDTLRQNALARGLTEDQFEVRWVTADEWAELKEPVARKRPARLSTDLWAIPADGEAFATVTFTSADPVHFSVNEEVHTVNPVDNVATIEITADAPGPIRVEVKDKQLVITAEAI